jgi:hypothetical protein
VTLAAGDRIRVADLPPALRTDAAEAVAAALAGNDTMRAWGARYARLMMDRCEQNKRKACRILDISYHTLVSYLQWRPERAAQAAASPHDACDEQDGAQLEDEEPPREECM